jgi:hypothetical protein
MHRCVPNARYILDEADGIHPRTASPAAQERCVQQGLGRRLRVHHPLFLSLFFSFFQISKLISTSLSIILPHMCDYMYYEELRKHKVKKQQVPEPEPELERIVEEEKPVIIKA